MTASLHGYSILIETTITTLIVINSFYIRGGLKEVLNISVYYKEDKFTTATKDKLTLI
jgi:hypothetical protein